MAGRAGVAAAVSNFTTPLHLEYLDGRRWRLLAGFSYSTLVGGAKEIHVPVGFETDFASIPRGLWNLFPPTGSYGKAAVIHDFLYRMWGTSRKDADKIFLEAMEVLGVGYLTRHALYRAVRVFGGSAYAKGQGQ